MSFEQLLRATYESNAESRDADHRLDARRAEIRRVLAPSLVLLKQAAKLFATSDATVHRHCETAKRPACRVAGKRLVDIATMHMEEEHEILLRGAI